MRPHLIGKDPTDIEDHWEKLYRDSFWVGGPMHLTSISAIDCALWDIMGKWLRVPVYKLPGGPTRSQVPVYCDCPCGSSPEQFAANVKACMDRGFTTLKTTLPIFYGENGSGQVNYSGTHGQIGRSHRETEFLSPSIFRRIRECFVATREAGGPDLGNAVDCHGRLYVKSAVRLCRALEDLDLMFVEEPVPPENTDALANVRRETSIPIAAGERWASIYGVREFLEKETVDILQCDLVNCGGITGLKKIAAMAEAHYVSMAPHNPNGPVATFMNLHFAASIPNYSLLETIGSEADWALMRELVHNPLRLENSSFDLPCTPGFGVDLNEDAIARHPYSPHSGWR